MQQQFTQASAFPPGPPPPFIFPPFPPIHTQPSPPAPEDVEQKSIIDKLANFVARNGPEFENVTKEKQKDNPKFSFLFGGEYHQYYVFKLNLERELIRFQQIPPPIIPNQPPPFFLPPPIQPESLASLQSKITNLQTQIHQSETNLRAQQEFLNSKTKLDTEELIRDKLYEKYKNLLAKSTVNIGEMESLFEKIIKNCTKESISNGRQFIFDKNLADSKLELILLYLILKIWNKESTPDERLHVIYFMNDLAYNSNKKNCDLIKTNLEKVIIPGFCYSKEKADEERLSKMNKLLDIWEKNNHFNKQIIESLKDNQTSAKYYEGSIIDEFRTNIKSIETEIKNQYKQYEQQHNDYLHHTQMQIMALQSQIQFLTNAHATQSLPTQQIQPVLVQSQGQAQNTLKPQPLMSLNLESSSPSKPIQPPTQPQVQPQPQTQPQSPAQPQPLMSIQTPQPNLKPAPPPTNIIIPVPIIKPDDLTKLPPSELNKTDLEVPYYNLPAGLMVPLIKTEDCDYKPLDPKLLKLPPPQPPTERLLKAVEEFYNPTKPRNEDGWEIGGLCEFYTSKMPFILEREKTEKETKEKEKKRSSSSSSSRSSSSSSSRSRTKRKSRSKRARGRSYSSRSSSRNSNSRSSSSSSARRSISSNSSRSRSRSTTSSSSSSSRSRSRTKNRKVRKRSYSRSSSSSRSSSRSPHSYSRSRSRSDSRSRSAAKPIRKKTKSKSRSATPPNLMFTSAASLTTRIENSNKGHQLLQKMGWSGQTGLGKKEQGIINPIEGGEVREKNDMYKGIGVKSDPFEAFRKNRSQTYIQRLRDRDEQREIAKRGLDKVAK